ncbi:hypothetical protein Tco_1042053 [Tanacetum coccineum]|uniref:Uncharacterized protein n=1 Tax=Tanacetum coccineum TaxID=301880 RepID=A0ABQ5GHY0_9ASTR
MAPLPLLEELSKTAMSTKTKDQLLILIQREVKEDASKVSEFKKLAGELLEDVRRRRGYIGELKKLKTNNDAIETVELLQRMQKDDLEEATLLLLMANKTKLKMQNKSSFILKLRGHLVSSYGSCKVKNGFFQLGQKWGKMIISHMSSLYCGNSIDSVIRRVGFAACVYLIWQERNYRIFRDEKRSIRELTDLFTEIIRMSTCFVDLQ